MSFITVIGTIVFFAVIVLALLAVIEIFFAPSNKDKINRVADARRKKPSWFRKRRALAPHSDESR